MKLFGKKSVLAGFVMVILGLTPVSAEKGKVEANAALYPYSYQNIDYKEFDSISSKYGIGGKLGARYFVLDSLFVGCEAGFETYFLEDYDSNYNSVKISPSVGYRYDFQKELYCQVSAFPQFVIDLYDGDAKPYFGAGAQLLGGYNITNKIGLELGVNFSMHWENHDNDDVSACIMNVGIPLGIKFTF